MSSDCIAGRTEFSNKDRDTLEARDGGKVAEVVE